MKALSPWLGLLAVAAFTGADLGAEQLKVATYNLENYGPANRMIEAGYRQDYPKPEKEKRALRAVIRGLNADVLVVQEMGPQPYLDELRRDLKTEGFDYPYAALASASDADRHLAILARRPLTAVTTHTDLSFNYLGGREPVKRGLLEATVSTASGAVTIFGVHLKSRFTERADDPLSSIRRAGEATAIRDRILQRFPASAEARVVVLGDCNDGRTSKALAFLQKRGRTEIVALLGGGDSRGEVWTHFYRKEETYSRVDHVLVSGALRDRVERGGSRVYDDEGVAEASDHRPVYVVLEL